MWEIIFHIHSESFALPQKDYSENHCYSGSVLLVLQNGWHGGSSHRLTARRLSITWNSKVSVSEWVSECRCLFVSTWPLQWSSDLSNRPRDPESKIYLRNFNLNKWKTNHEKSQTTLQTTSLKTSVCFAMLLSRWDTLFENSSPRTLRPDIMVTVCLIYTLDQIPHDWQGHTTTLLKIDKQINKAMTT